MPDLISWTNNSSNPTQGRRTITEGAYVTFLNQAGGRAMGIWQNSTTAGARVAQWIDNGRLDKQWKPIAASNGYVQIESRSNPALYLTGATANGAVTIEAAIDAASDAAANDSQEWPLVAR